MAKLHVKSHTFRTLQTGTAVTLPFPIHPNMRLATLSESTPGFGILKPFRAESMIGLQSFRPNIVAGTAQELHELAEQVDFGKVDMSSVDHALLAFTRCGHKPLTDVMRVILWQTFGVPIYEIFAGLDNTILGYECELHEGWHLPRYVRMTETDGEWMLDAPGTCGLQTALTGILTTEVCPCGRLGRRLLDVQPALRTHIKRPYAVIA